jgi:hypothetical protein
MIYGYCYKEVVEVTMALNGPRDPEPVLAELCLL